MPALIAPAFAIGGYWGAVVWIAALAALGSTFVWKAGYIVTRDVGAAWFAWSAVVLTAPAVLHGTLIYPDPIGGMMLAGGALALVSTRERWGKWPDTGHAEERTDRWRLDDPPPGALLYLSDVPSGDYRLRVKRQPSAHGELFVGVGRATAAAWQASLADGWPTPSRFTCLLSRRALS